MSYAITIIREATYVRLTIAGGISSLDQLQRFGQELILIAKEYDCRKFLVDARQMDYTFSMLDLISWGEGLVHLGFPRRGYKIASVRSDLNSPQGRIMETVLNNRSITYRPFMRIDEAAEWLGVGEYDPGNPLNAASVLPYPPSEKLPCSSA